jgi:hypothetical protein
MRHLYDELTLQRWIDEEYRERVGGYVRHADDDIELRKARQQR